MLETPNHHYKGKLTIVTCQWQRSHEFKPIPTRPIVPNTCSLINLAKKGGG